MGRPSAQIPPDLSRLVLEQSPSPVAAVDGSGHILRYVNPAFCRLVEQPADQLIGRSFEDVLPGENKCTSLVDEVCRSGKPVSHNEENRSTTHPLVGSYTIWPLNGAGPSAAAVIQLNESGQFRADFVAMNEALLLGSLRQHELVEAASASNVRLRQEIEEHARSEDELRRAQEQLSDRAGQLEQLVAARTTELTLTNEQLEAFVYSIAHDLRAPLRAMQGFSTLLVEEAGIALSDTGKRYAARVIKAGQFMDALLADLLDFARVSQRQVELQSVDLQSVVDSVLSRLGNAIALANARVDCLGPWPRVFAHEPTLAQVLFNLVSNALKFNAPGVAPVLRLRTEEFPEAIRIWVEDNGVGIEPDYQKQIFGLFTRLNGEKYPGTGVGLAIVQTGVGRMGGRVGVESVVNQGSRFWFELRKA